MLLILRVIFLSVLFQSFALATVRTSLVEADDETIVTVSFASSYLRADAKAEVVELLDSAESQRIRVKVECDTFGGRDSDRFTTFMGDLLGKIQTRKNILNKEIYVEASALTPTEIEDKVAELGLEPQAFVEEVDALQAAVGALVLNDDDEPMVYRYNYQEHDVEWKASRKYPNFEYTMLLDGMLSVSNPANVHACTHGLRHKWTYTIKEHGGRLLHNSVGDGDNIYGYYDTMEEAKNRAFEYYMAHVHTD